MAPFPTILTHTYHPGHGPLGNLCDRPKAEAAALLLRWRGVRPAYLDRRLAVEDWLIAESRRIINGVRLTRPRYLFVGDFSDGLNPHRPASIAIPLALIPPERLTFTYPDSMTSCLLATRPDLASEHRDHHGQLFDLTGIKDLVARIGLPERHWPRAAGALSDGFVEAQLWDAAPFRRFVARAAYNPATAATSS